VLLRDGAPPFLERTAELLRGFEGIGTGCDLVAYTESEWEQMRREGRRLVHAVLDEGVELARRSEEPTKR
jgi:hypothetical protein